MKKADDSAPTCALWVRSICFHVASGSVTLGFLILSPLILAPRAVVWACLRRYIGTQLWLLRVICGQRYRVIDAQTVPDGPCILASRHEALWETLVLPYLFNNPAVLLKQDILKYPLVGTIAAKLGGIGIDRSGSLDTIRKPFEAARSAARQGRKILIFPSGTRDPAHRYRVQTGVAVLYRLVDAPVVPIVLNSGAFWIRKSWLRRPGEIIIRILPPIPAGLATQEFVTRLKTDLSRPAL